MLKRSARDLVAEANTSVTTIDADKAARLASQPGTLFIDVREPGELAQNGTVEGAVNVPRGLLEFQADPQSPVHRPELEKAKRLILYCASGSRSALAAKSLNEMGFDNVAHVAGGFAALKTAGAAVVSAESAGIPS